MSLLAAANALLSISGNRHRAYWDVAGTEAALPLLGSPRFQEATPLLSKPDEAQETIADYAATGLTLGVHPLALLRSRLTARRVLQSMQLPSVPNGQLVRVAGLVLSARGPVQRQASCL